MLKRHPISANYPDITGAAWDDFCDNLKRVGCERKIVMHEGMILDGWQLHRACLETNTEPKFKDLPKGVDPQEYVDTANDRRRHETVEKQAERREERRGRAVGLRKEGMSERAIADELNISKTTVHNDLEEANKAGGQVGPPETVTGIDGKEYPATQPPKLEKPLCVHCQGLKRKGLEPVKRCAGCREIRKPQTDTSVKGDADEGELEKFTDDEKKDVPAIAIPAFQAAKDISTVCHELDKIQKTIRESSKLPGWEMMNSTSVLQNLKNCRQTIFQSRATHVCPYCLGENLKCTCCKGRGWTVKSMYSQAPEEIK